MREPQIMGSHANAHDGSTAFAIEEAIRQDTAHSGMPSERAIFGEFVFDLGRRELLRAGSPLHVSPKGLQLLETMLRAAPDAVSKEQAYRELWGDVFVEETNIANLVSELRNALGDDGRSPRLIRTLYRFGYRFDAPVQWEEQPKQAAPFAGRAWIVWATREFPLIPGENLIGRDPEAQVAIDSAAISRRHARIIIGEHVLLEDLGSKNGTFVTGERISAPVELHDGDTVGFGSIRVLFRLVRDLATTVTDLHSPV